MTGFGEINRAPTVLLEMSADPPCSDPFAKTAIAMPVPVGISLEEPGKASGRVKSGSPAL